jgi:hypothetical protein
VALTSIGSAGFKSGKVNDVYFLVVIVSILTTFSQSVYGQVKPNLGGGRPPAIRILLERNLPFATTARPLAMFLLDENANGMYVIRSRTSRQAFWIPRDAVAAVIYDAPRPGREDLQFQAPSSP